MKGAVERAVERRDYIVGRELGRGATAVVYYVTDIKSGLAYACKVSRRQELIQREAELLKKRVCSLFPLWKENWSEGDAGILVMEFVPGRSLGEVLDKRGRISWRQAVRFAAELAEGLGKLHDQGYVCRDLKPENIIIQENGRIRLVDLGAACRIGETGDRAGTRGYAAPEQMKKGCGAGEKNDVFALGRVLFFLLTGKNPCRFQKTLIPVRSCDPSLPRGLDRLVAACAESEEDGRIPDMREILRRLAPYLSPGSRDILFTELRLMLRCEKGWEYVCEKDIWKSSCTAAPGLERV